MHIEANRIKRSPQHLDKKTLTQAIFQSEPMETLKRLLQADWDSVKARVEKHINDFWWCQCGKMSLERMDHAVNHQYCQYSFEKPSVYWHLKLAISLEHVPLLALIKKKTLAREWHLSAEDVGEHYTSVLETGQLGLMSLFSWDWGIGLSTEDLNAKIANQYAEFVYQVLQSAVFNKQDMTRLNHTMLQRCVEAFFPDVNQDAGDCYDQLMFSLSERPFLRLLAPIEYEYSREELVKRGMLWTLEQDPSLKEIVESLIQYVLRESLGQYREGHLLWVQRMKAESDQGNGYYYSYIKDQALILKSRILSCERGRRAKCRSLDHLFSKRFPPVRLTYVESWKIRMSKCFGRSSRVSESQPLLYSENTRAVF